MNWTTIAGIAAFGIVILGFGIYVAHFAEEITRDAHATLQGMFGHSMPHLFETQADPAGARIAGVVATVAGGLLVAAAVVLFLAR